MAQTLLRSERKSRFSRFSGNSPAGDRLLAFANFMTRRSKRKAPVG
jgi:hypothetical protein